MEESIIIASFFCFYYGLRLIPIAYTLFKFADIVFTIGEFKQHSFVVPKIFLIILIKLIFFGLLQLIILDYLFYSHIFGYFYFLSIYINFYILFEMINTHKYVLSYRKYLKNYIDKKLNKDEFNTFVEFETKKILIHNLFIFVATNLLMLLLIILVIIGTYLYFTYLNCILTFLIIGSFILKHLLFKIMANKKSKTKI